MADLKQAIGTAIRTERRRHKLTVRELADLAAISAPYLGEIERGKKYPSAQILEHLARALETEMANILELAAEELRGEARPRRINAIGFPLPPRGSISPRALVDQVVELLPPEDVVVLGEMGAFLAARQRAGPGTRGEEGTSLPRSPTSGAGRNR